MTQNRWMNSYCLWLRIILVFHRMSFKCCVPSENQKTMDGLKDNLVEQNSRPFMDSLKKTKILES